MGRVKKSVILGFIAGSGLLVLYFGILSLAESFSHAVSQFLAMWYWILILVVGFGIQVGLFGFIREKQKMVSGKAVAASGGISTGAMIACCLHHLIDVLPLMGLAAAAVFLTQYQVWFIILGILSNLVGITIMLEIIKKHNLAEGFFKRALIYNMGQIKKITIATSLVLLAISFFIIGNQKPPMRAIDFPNQKPPMTAIDLPSKTDSQRGISFKITPLDFNIDKPVKFEIKIDTHSGSLDFDLRKISLLEDNLGNQYQPLEWQGSGPGGHHRVGVLIFPKLRTNQAKKIELTIKDNPNFLARSFVWDLE